MLVKHVLNVGNRDVLAAADDDVLGAAGDREVPVGVDGGEVAGLEPVAVERLAGHREPLGVADEEERPGDLQAAYYARCRHRPVVGEHPHSHARPRVPVGVDQLLVGVAGYAEGDQDVFGLPPAAKYCQPGQLGPRLPDDRAGDGSAHAAEQPQARQIMLVEVGRVDQVVQERRGR